jgi:hypothetical protein
MTEWMNSDSQLGVGSMKLTRAERPSPFSDDLIPLHHDSYLMTGSTMSVRVILAQCLRRITRYSRFWDPASSSFEPRELFHRLRRLSCPK